MNEPWYDRGTARRSPSEILSALRRLSPFLRPLRASIVRATVCLLLATAAALAPPWILGRVYDTVFARTVLSPGVSTFSSRPAWTDVYRQLLWLGAATLAAQTAALALGRSRDRVTRRVQALLVTDVRRELARKASRLTGRDLITAPPGRIEAILIGDVEVLEGLVFQGIETFLVAPIAFVTTLGILFLLDPGLAWVTLLPIPFLVAVILARVRPLRALAETERAAASDLTDRAASFLGALLLARTYGCEDREAARTAEAARDARFARLASEHTMAAHLSFVGFLATLAGSGILLYGGVRVLDLKVSAGVVLAFLNYSTTLYPSLIEVTRANYILQNVAVAMSRIRVLLDAPEERRNEGGPIPADGPLAVSLSGVRFSYEAGKEVLTGGDLDLPAGGRVAISGASGGGKTTLARIVVGLLPPDAGAVRVGGISPTESDVARFRRRVALVAQEEALPGETVAEVLRYARPEATDAELQEALSGAALSCDLAARIGPRGWAASGGERQRLAIARALVTRPRLLVLDEATSAVDLETEAAIHHALAATRGCTIVVITHRTGSVAWADRHLRMEGGRLVDLASPPSPDRA